MKCRIAMWASAGFLVAGGWALYFLSANKQTPIGGFTYALACITQPIALFIQHSAVSVYWVLLANAATYALAGFVLQTLRQKLPHTE